MKGKSMYRQGDVLLIPKNVHEKAKIMESNGPIILALGEATGHAHAIHTEGVRVFEHEGTRWIRVPKNGATLVHEEHGSIDVLEGEYEVRIQKEYTPKGIRNVKD